MLGALTMAKGSNRRGKPGQDSGWPGGRQVEVKEDQVLVGRTALAATW